MSGAVPLQLFSGPTATILAALIGVLTGFVGSIGMRMWEQHQLRTHTRRALLAEIETMDRDGWDDHTDTELRPNEAIQVSHTGIHTTVYDTHIDNLGLLSSAEIEPVVKYYDHLKTFEEQLSKLETDPSAALLESFQGTTAPKCKSYQGDAITALGGTD